VWPSATSSPTSLAADPPRTTRHHANACARSRATVTQRCVHVHVWQSDQSVLTSIEVHPLRVWADGRGLGQA
jgi:hypothetical protein